MGIFTSLSLLAMLLLIQTHNVVHPIAARETADARSAGCPPAPFCKAAVCPACPQPALVHGVLTSQVQDLAFTFIELHKVFAWPLRRNLLRWRNYLSCTSVGLLPLIQLTCELHEHVDYATEQDRMK